jgi:hypothetical protein
MRVFNMTSRSLTKIGDHLDHGEFTEPFFPPQTIVPDQRGEWRAESAGILTGTEGSVDYQVEGRGDRIHLSWDNPTVGNTFFDFPTPTQGGGPSDFVFFPLHFAVRGDVEPDPGSDPPLIAVTQGDVGGSTGIILPLPDQEKLKPHAFFEVGIRDKREPVSLQRWLKATSIGSLSEILQKNVSFRQLVELPF